MFNSQFTNPLFIDIETVSCAPSFDELTPALQKCWQKKARRLGAKDEKEGAQYFFEKGGIFAEFGKIIVIAVGYIVNRPDGKPELRIKGLAHDDEITLLQEFATLLRQFPASAVLCGHNGKEFDFPYLARRMVVNQVPLPAALDISGKKPWEVNHKDTMEMWKFGDYKNYTSLDLLAAIFSIPSSKEIMHGSEVNHYYYVRKELQKIKQYCMADVALTAQVFRKMRFLPLLDEGAVVHL